jgi:hypothetical protein
MIVANISNGLGNQLFQYASAKALSLRLNEPLKIISNSKTSDANWKRYEILRAFDIPDSIATSAELNDMIGWRGYSYVRIFYKPFTAKFFSADNCIIELHHQFYDRLKTQSKNIYLHGYWQSEKYFINYKEIILGLLKFRNPLSIDDLRIASEIKEKISISLHIRRGDYLNKKVQRVLANCDLQYYADAIKLMKSRFGDVRFFCFSDDIDWVVDNLTPYLGDHVIVSHNISEKSSNDMRLMSFCNHHIIANSTFSWWGAWLNTCNDKVVIAPKKWFVNGLSDRDLIPAGWFRI